MCQEKKSLREVCVSVLHERKFNLLVPLILVTCTPVIASSSPLARDCVLNVLQILEHLLVRARHALLDAIGREHAEPRVAAEERVPIGVCARPHDVELQIAQGATAGREAAALLSGKVAPIEGLLGLFSRGNAPVEVECVRLALRHFAENARIVPGDAKDVTFVDINNGSKERVYALERKVDVASKEGESAQSILGE